ncbi:hypothetical protein MASR2M79_07020 [Aminivibrio sp.]
MITTWGFILREKVFEGTDGQIKIDVFSGAPSATGWKSSKWYGKGSIEMSMAQASANLTTAQPRLLLPTSSNSAEAKKVYRPDGWAYKIIVDLWAKHNIKALAVIPLGMTGVSLNECPKKSTEPGASHGLKVRVMPIKPCEWTCKP